MPPSPMSPTPDPLLAPLPPPTPSAPAPSLAPARPAPTVALSPVEAELETLIRARYPLIYVVSWEERRVEETLRDICGRRGKKMILWTYTTGMAGNVASRDPLAALDYIMGAPDQSVFVLKDFHPFISDVAVTRRLRDLVYALKTSYKTLILLSPLLKLPPELEKEITVVDYQLPTLAEIDRLLENIIQSVKNRTEIKTEMTPLEREQVLKAASGLTSNEAENVFAKSLVEKRKFDIDVILGEKEQIIRKSGILEYYRASEAFADVGGMDLLKGWMTRRTASFTDEAKRYGLPDPKGILLLGVQGCGKSLSAKAIASLWRLPLLRLDVGKVFAGIVGSSEENMRKAIATAESVAPCVAGDTRITLADGSERTIADLWESKEDALSVLGMQSDFSIAPVSVQAITRRPAPDLFTVRLRHAELQATSNHLHPVLRNGELIWVRTDALQTSDYVAVPRQIPTADTMPKMAAFLPDETRLYLPNAMDWGKPETQTPQRRYAAKNRGGDFVKLSELTDLEQVPPFEAVTRFAVGRGGTADTTLSRLPETLHNDMGYLLGLIESDGYLGKRGRIGFVNTETKLHDRFADLLCGLFDLSAVRRENAPGQSANLPGTTAGSVFLPCYTSYVDNRLLCGILRNVSARLLTMPAAFLNAYLRGYFDGDGFVSDPKTKANPKIVLTAKRPEQNARLRAVLQRVGLLASNAGRFNIEITGVQTVRRFIEQIGSHHPMRHERMEVWEAKTELVTNGKDRTDAIPVGQMLRSARQGLGMGSQNLAGTSAALISRYETGAAHPCRARLLSIIGDMERSVKARNQDAALLTLLQTLANSAIGWSQVVSVTAAPTPEFVYDLVCDAPHNFIANGMVTHNCILWIDELEKGFAGTQSSAFSDGGTTSRVFGSFITWLQEKEAPCFVVATSNDVSQLPPELMRKGRFDEIFFVDLPATAERAEIFAIHLRKRNRDPEKFDLNRLAEQSVGYSGAEIEQVVVAALFASFADNMREVTTEDLLKTAKESIPLSVTMREGIQKLRDWAETRARPSSSETAEPTDDLAQLDSANRYDTSPEMLRKAAASSASPYTMESGAENLPARVEALERKTATGLDSMMHMTQNENPSPPAPAMPTVEGEGTGAPVGGPAVSTAGSEGNA